MNKNNGILIILIGISVLSINLMLFFSTSTIPISPVDMRFEIFLKAFTFFPYCISVWLSIGIIISGIIVLFLGGKTNQKKN